VDYHGEEVRGGVEEGELFRLLIRRERKNVC
jgi:hypothetical protein